MVMRTKGWLLGAAGAAAFGFTALTAGEAKAVFELAASGTASNLCSGIFGTFPDCNPATAEGLPFEDGFGVDDVDTPLVAKYEWASPNGAFGFVFEDPLAEDEEFQFPSVTADDFSFSDLGFGGEGESEGPVSGTWTYNGEFPDPFVTAYALKFAQNYELYVWAGEGLGGFSDSFEISQGLSNITFYDTGIIPLPAAAWMMIAGLGAIGGVAARRRRAAADA